MPLPANLSKVFTRWLVEKKIKRNCPECNHLNASAEWVGAPTLNKKGQMEESTSVPLIALTCSNCGHVRLFSAVKAGLLPGLHRAN